MTTKLTVRALVAVCLISLGTASTVNAGAIPIVDISNDADYSWTWAEDLTLGYEFTVTSTLTFNALAVFDVISANPATGHVNVAGLNESHQVAVWDALGNIVVSATVDPSDPTASSANTYGEWVYQTVAPTTLLAGNYTIGAYYEGSLANSDPVMVQQTALDGNGAVYIGGRYLYSSTFDRPTFNYPPNEEQYFGPTMLSVPDGGMALTLLGGAMLGLAALRRKFTA